MNSDKNIQGLVNENKRLLAELARLEADNARLDKELADLRGKQEIVGANGGAIVIQYEAPKPKFAVGDKVIHVIDKVYQGDSAEQCEIVAITLLSDEYRYSIRYMAGHVGSYPRLESEIELAP